jgi:uncharacterized membrane protein
VISRPTGRLESIDFLRGVVMILMALDHVREFFGNTANPTNPATTTAALFFTRWITHFCAPVFFLLAGTSAALALRNGSIASVSRFLLLRGVWLIVLEFVAVRWIMQFNIDYHVTMLTVMWALGWSMIALAILVHLPTPAVTAAGVAMIASHNLLDAIRPSAFGSFAPLWTALHNPGVIVSDSRHVIFAAYPLVPWVGVVAAGYGLGQVYGWTAERRQAFLWRLGIALTTLFLVLRAANAYGDPAPWTPQRSIVFTSLSFLNTSKYPPSLIFLLMTLGPALCVLAAADRGLPKLARAPVVFGRVPLFYFLLHLLVIHLLALVVCYLRYGDTHWVSESPTLDQFPFARPPGWPVDLPVVYVIWASVVVATLPMCRWFAAVKARRRDPWLRFF